MYELRVGEGSGKEADILLGIRQSLQSRSRRSGRNNLYNRGGRRWRGNRKGTNDHEGILHHGWEVNERQTTKKQSDMLFVRGKLRHWVASRHPLTTSRGLCCSHLAAACVMSLTSPMFSELPHDAYMLRDRAIWTERMATQIRQPEIPSQPVRP